MTLIFQMLWILLSLNGARAYIYVYCSKHSPNRNYDCYNATTVAQLYAYSSSSGQPQEHSNTLWLVGTVTCNNTQTSEICNDGVSVAYPSSTKNVYFNISGLQPHSKYQITINSIFTSDGSFRDDYLRSFYFCTGSIGSLIPGKLFRVTATHVGINLEDFETQIIDSYFDGVLYNHKHNSVTTFHGYNYWPYYVQNFYYHIDYDRTLTFPQPGTLYTMYIRNYTSGCNFQPHISFQLCSAPLTPILDIKPNHRRIYVYSASNRSDYDSLKVTINHPNTPPLEALPGFFDNLIPDTRYEITVTVELGSKTDCKWNDPVDLIDTDTFRALTFANPDEYEDDESSNNQYITYEDESTDLTVKMVEGALILAFAVILIYLVADKIVAKRCRKLHPTDARKNQDGACKHSASDRVVPGADYVNKAADPKMPEVVTPQFQSISNYSNPSEEQDCVYDDTQFKGDELNTYMDPR